MLPFSPLSLALRRRESSSRYRIRSRFFAIAVLLFSCAVFCACSSEDKKRGQENPEQKYPKLRNYTLDLSIISTRGNYRRSDVNPILRFSVRNAGANQLSIHEWKMHEQENIRVLYAPCPGTRHGDKTSSGSMEGIRTADPERRRSPLSAGTGAQQRRARRRAAELHPETEQTGTLCRQRRTGSLFRFRRKRPD